MKDSKKIKKFMEGLKKGKMSAESVFAEWLENYGIAFKKFNEESIREEFHNNPDRMVGNEEQIEKIGTVIGHYLRRKNAIYHIPIIGVKGSGKTLLIIATLELAGTIEELEKPKGILAPIFIWKDIGSREKLFSIISEKVDIIAIDPCEGSHEIVPLLIKLSKKIKKGILITSWTPEWWQYLHEKIEDIFPNSTPIIIKPLRLNEKSTEFLSFMEAVYKIIFKDLKTRNAFEVLCYENHYGDFHMYSAGIPSIALKLLFETLNSTFRYKRTQIDGGMVIEAVENLELFNLLGEWDISTQHKEILKQTLLHENEKGIRPMDLVKEIKLSKSTISYHLSKLTKDFKILENETIGKSSYYRIKKNLVPIFQLKILREEFKKEFV